MDFDQNNNHVEPAPQPVPAIPTVVQSPRKRGGWRIFWSIFIGLSIVVNIIMFLMLVGMAAFMSTGPKNAFTEEVVRRGPRANKIAIINIYGIIYDEQAQSVYKQLEVAGKDSRIKGLIVRVNSPGGLVSSSDQIYNEIRKWRRQTGKPVVAFMEGVAASGGYYTSVACDKIVAEPTVITGSIGVIMKYFVLQELLEEKLGIKPIVVKSGRKKDWPSMFHQPEEEQLQYLRDKLISPSYERFIGIIDESREQLSLAEVRELADGSIYGAKEALEVKLIDAIGYLDEAIVQIKSLAGIEKALIIEYRRPFSLAGFLGAQSKGLLKIDRASLYELTTPQLMYLWSPYE